MFSVKGHCEPGYAIIKFPSYSYLETIKKAGDSIPDSRAGHFLFFSSVYR